MTTNHGTGSLGRRGGDPTTRMADDLVQLMRETDCELGSVDEAHLARRGWSPAALSQYGAAAVSLAQERLAAGERRAGR